ncbi:MAG: 1,2-phenylacetyl-CoA epoxidase subunit PaaD [Bacteroidia bacterium]
MVTTQISKEKLFLALSEIPDPEIPVINIFEMGIIRDISFVGETCVVTITPTYTGCPAMQLIEDLVKEKLKENGIEQTIVKTVYNPAWTTDWMSPITKEKLRNYGIAPPVESSCNKCSSCSCVEVACPLCKSKNTELISQFGSTACKALYKCNSCKEPFEYFKSH